LCANRAALANAVGDSQRLLQVFVVFPAFSLHNIVKMPVYEQHSRSAVQKKKKDRLKARIFCVFGQKKAHPALLL
jgi:hypothetical protein